MKKIDLTGYTGTEAYHKVDLFSGLLATDGIVAMAKSFGAYWLASDILINQKMLPELRNEEFVTWKLKKEHDGAILVAEDSNGNFLYKQEYYFTDFPFGNYISSMSDDNTFTMFFTNKILLLPSEN